MDELRKFIKDMRQQQLSDELIYKNLIQKGWDERLVSEAFLPAGTVVPEPSGGIAKMSKILQKAPSALAKSAANRAATPDDQTDPSLDPKPSFNLVSGAQSALHHIFLWVFSLAFIVNIQIIIHSIIEQDFSDNFGKTLASSASILLITGVVYWLFYFRFIKALKQNNQLRLQGAWTVATIVFGGLTAIGFLIGLVISLIWSADYENLIRFSPIVFYSGLVVLTYAQINFAKPESKLRQRLARIWYAVLVGLILMVSMVAAGLTYLNKKADLDLKQEMASAASKLYQYYQKERVLPVDLGGAGIASGKLSYEVLPKDFSQSRFKLCANFQHADYQETSYYKNYRTLDEIYVYNDKVPAGQIKVREAGNNCFIFNLKQLDY